MIPIQLSKISGFLQIRSTGPSGPFHEEHVLRVPHHAEGGSPRQALRLLEFGEPLAAMYLQTGVGADDTRLRTCTTWVVLS